MKKKIISLLLTGCLVMCPFVSSAQDVDISNMTLEELQQAYLELQQKYDELLSKSSVSSEPETDYDFEYSAEGFTYKYLKNEVKNIGGSNYVFVFFEYTNNSNDTAIPYYSLVVSAFQNGVEISSYMSIDDGVPEADVAYKEVKSGTTTNVAFKFELSDESPVSIEIQPMVSFGDVEIGEFTIDLNI